jgi:hypothetical protein
MRKVRINWIDLDAACQSGDGDCAAYLDRASGEMIVVDGEVRRQLEEFLDEREPTDDASFEQALTAPPEPVPQGLQQALRDAWRVEQGTGEDLLSLDGLDPRETVRDRDAFIAMLPDPKLRAELEQACHGPGSWRRFRHVLDACFRERKQWFAFQDECRRRHATDWLAAHDIAVEWILPSAPEPGQGRPPPRTYLLEGVLKFTRRVAQLRGVTRIALLGLLTRDEPDPKDADLLVTVADDMDLAALAKAGRSLAGHAQQAGRGADVFLANPRGEYIGRTCHWRECAPGIRVRCEALHCGRRHFLYDDLDAVRLERALVAEPPVELWPTIHARVPVPADVEVTVLAPLRAGRA